MVGKKKPKRKAISDKKSKAKSLPPGGARRRTFTCIKGPDPNLQPQYGYFTASDVTLQEFSFRNRILRVHLNKCDFKDLTPPRRFRSNTNKNQPNLIKRVTATNSLQAARRKAASVQRPKTVKQETPQLKKLRSVRTRKSVRTRRNLESPSTTPKTVRKGRPRKRKLNSNSTKIVKKVKKPVSPAPNNTKTVKRGRPRKNTFNSCKTGKKVIKLSASTRSNKRQISPAPNRRGRKPVSRVETPENIKSKGLTVYGLIALLQKGRKPNQKKPTKPGTTNRSKTRIKVVRALDKNRNFANNPNSIKKKRRRKMPIVQNNTESNLDRLLMKPQVYKEEPRLNYKFQKLVSDVKTMKLPTLQWKIKVIIRENKISAIRFTNKSEIERSVSFEADRDIYDIIIDNAPALLIGSPGVLDKPEDIEVLLDIVQNIDKSDPMIKYL